jgi:hypothetical protein
MKIYFVVITIIFFCFGLMLALNRVHADTSSPETPKPLAQRVTLKGLKGIYVAIEERPEVEKLGLSVEKIETDVKFCLLQNRIEPLLFGEAVGNPEVTMLFVTLDAIPIEKSSIAWKISVEVRQKVTLQRDPRIHCIASTWRSGSFGYVAPEKFKDLSGNIKVHVDEFIKDYLAVNSPK